MFNEIVINQLQHSNRYFEELNRTVSRGVDKRIRLSIVFQYLAKNKPFDSKEFLSVFRSNKKRNRKVFLFPI
jgi:hypothetical protein